MIIPMSFQIDCESKRNTNSFALYSFGIVFLIVLISMGFLIVGIESIIAGVFGPKRRLEYTTP